MLIYKKPKTQISSTLTILTLVALMWAHFLSDKDQNAHESDHDSLNQSEK